jgi:ubiquinone biosynthesis protein
MGLGAYRPLRAGYVLARRRASIIDRHAVPPGRVSASGWAVARTTLGQAQRQGRALTKRLNRLGPTYVKFGQTLATRPDIVGLDIAAELAVLQDAMERSRWRWSRLSGRGAQRQGATLPNSPLPIAAASIAQVHKAVLVDAAGKRQQVASRSCGQGSSSGSATISRAIMPARGWLSGQC